MRYLAAVAIFLTVVISGCANSAEMPENNDTSTVPSNVSENATIVTHTTAGFEPSTVTVEKGETVVWQSETSSMWVASDRHPTHTEYSGTSESEHCQSGDQNTAAFDQCSEGSSFSFTFEKTGEWSYHNHRNSFQGGTVIVE
jgi:plastocyanin